MSFREGPLRAVVAVVFHQMPYTKWGWGQNFLQLECGHSTTQKTSIPVPRRARCRDCHMSIART